MGFCRVCLVVALLCFHPRIVAASDLTLEEEGLAEERMELEAVSVDDSSAEKVFSHDDDFVDTDNIGDAIPAIGMQTEDIEKEELIEEDEMADQDEGVVDVMADGEVDQEVMANDSSENNFTQQQDKPLSNREAFAMADSYVLAEAMQGEVSDAERSDGSNDTQSQHLETQKGEEEVDERTLLDIFGEVSKEFLTQRVIPDTDEQCRWDWRSLRCEPACECLFDGKWGDYHLGRSCRLHNVYGDGSTSEQCIPVDPAVVLREAPVPKRIISLVSQTMEILHFEMHRGLQKVRHSVVHEGWEPFRERICRDTWALADRIVEQAQVAAQRQQPYNYNSNETCVPASMVLTLHMTRSFWERALCGPPKELKICEASAPPSSARPPPPSETTTTTTTTPPQPPRPPRQFE